MSADTREDRIVRILTEAAPSTEDLRLVFNALQHYTDEEVDLFISSCEADSSILTTLISFLRYRETNEVPPGQLSEAEELFIHEAIEMDLIDSKTTL
jgi:hypothetical protein